MRKALLYSNESVHILESEEEKFQESFSCGGEGEGARPQDSSLSGARDVDEIKKYIVFRNIKRYRGVSKRLHSAVYSSRDRTV